MSVSPGESNRQPTFTLGQGWIMLLRVLLLIVALVGIALLVGGIPARLAQLRTVCEEAICPALILVPADVLVLEQWGIGPRGYAFYHTLLEFILIAPVTVLWVVIFRRYTHILVGVLTCLALVFLGVSLGNIAWAWTQVNATVALVYGLLGELAGTALVVLLYLFPDGRMIPRWVRYCIGVELLLILPYGIVRLFLPQSATIELIDGIELAIELALVALVVVAQIIRYRRLDNGAQRQQTKWVVMGIAALILGILIWFVTMEFAPFDPGTPRATWNLLGMPLLMVLSAAFPVSLGVAILRYRLWDIDLIINRAVVYSLLTALVVAIYALIVSGLGRFFHNENNTAISLAATGVIAILFQPLHLRIQTGVNRWLFGERDDPARVLTRLTSELEAAESGASLLQNLVETIAESLKLPYVALRIQDGDTERLAAATGHRPEQVETWPLMAQQTTIGHLIIAPRSPGDPLSAADQNLLAAITRLTATTVRTVQLTDDVQEARVRTVAAREEERRRLRRDLHDGLGPVLASQALKLAAARQLLRDKPEVAEQLLDEVMYQSENTVAEVRRLVYALRPPTLDELGLVEAIREHVDTVRAAAPVTITIDAPSRLPEIPAAIEVAAFRIVQEALNNVIRHADAHHCTITLAVDDALAITIQDDGQGIAPESRSGVGLLSMHERAAEVGGTCEIDALPAGGVRVRLVLPLPVAQ